jgi:hypothetical protein
MKEPLFIDTKMTVKAEKWSDLKQYGKSIGGILYLPIGLSVNRLPIWKTKTAEEEELQTNQQETVDIKQLENNENYSTSEES